MPTLKTYARLLTYYATNIMSGHNIQQTIQSPYPSHNVWHRKEPIASDTVFSHTSAIDTNSQTMSQIFDGRKSLILDVFGMSNKNEFVNTLEYVIQKRGAIDKLITVIQKWGEMDKLITDSAAVEMSKLVNDILQTLCIYNWQSEPHYQHQNFAEHRWK